MKKRKDISNEYKWDFSDYFASEAEWEKCFEEYSAEL